MLNLLRRLFRHPTKIQIVPRDPLRLTVDEFRSQPDLVKLAKEELRRPVLRQMLDSLHWSHLRRYTATGTAEEKAFHLCRCEGYLSAMDDFERLGVSSKPEEVIESTFESPEESEK